MGLGTLATQSGTFSGTSSGTNTGDQTISLTGDVTGSGTGSFAATIANNVVSNAKFRQGAARSVVGVTGNAVSNVADISGTADQILRVNGAGNGLAFGAIDLSKSAAVGTSVLPVANGGTGQTTQQAAINALAGSQASGQFLRGNGTNVVMSAIQVADVPTLNQSTTGTANIAGGTVGAIPYQTGANTTSVVAATATANKVLMSGSNAAPVWSTPAYPNASATSGKVIISDGTNYIASTPTFPNAAGTVGNVIRADASGNFVSSATATNQINNIDPASITNNTPRLLRINGATGAPITPSKSGKVLVIISGNAVGNDMYVQMYYRVTNPAAAHGDATTGFTALGTNTYVSNSGTVRSFSLNSVVTGLTIGLTYYFDLAIYSSSSNTVTASNITVSIVEL